MPTTAVKNIILSADDCEKIRKRLPGRTAQLVIESIYTITNLAFDPTSKLLVDRLILAAAELKKKAIGNDFSKEAYLDLYCFDAAETLIRAAKQRATNLSLLTHESQITFDIPSPNVRLYYESCEYVVDSLLSLFDEKAFKNYYVLFDTVDGPKFMGLAIKMPSHRLTDPTVYTALSHEAFHIYFTKFHSRLLSSKNISHFIFSGKLSSIENEELYRLRLIEEITVECLDFCFTYLYKYRNYMEDEWSFFGQHFKDSIKSNLDPDRLTGYLLRTFSVLLLYNCVSHREPPSVVISIRPEIRRLLNQHVEDAKKILMQRHAEFNGPHFYNIIHKLQTDLEGLAAELDEIFHSLNKVVNNFSQNIDCLKNYSDNPKIKGFIDNIAEGKVLNEHFRYPHLIVNGLSRAIRHKRDDKNYVSKASNALVLSLWNSNLIEKRQGK